MSSIPKIYILYGTETFNSYEFSILLSHRLKLNHYNNEIYSMNDFPLKKLIEGPIITYFISSTFHNGDNPSNTTIFWKFLLQKKLPLQFLNNLQFSTFGLGDSSYPKFNHFIKKLHVRLLQLGAKEINVRGESDEQSFEGIEAFYKEWEEIVLSNLQLKYPIISDFNDTIENQLDYELIINKNNGKIIIEDYEINNNIKNLKIGKVLQNQRITSFNHFQDVRNLIIEYEGSQDLNPGDIILLYPLNDLKIVNKLIETLNWNDIADYPIKINKLTEVFQFNEIIEPLTIRKLFLYHLDIMSIPRRSFFMKIYKFVNDNFQQREKLFEFSQLSNTEDLFNYTTRPRRSIMETILEFDGLSIPIENVLDIFPILRPRMFSISKINERSFELTIGIVEYKTMLKRLRKGVCTSWIKNSVKENDKIGFSVKKSNIMKKISKFDTLILIGPGTGIAPIRSIIHHFKNDLNKIFYLFTGNRFEDKDYLYGEEFALLNHENFKIFPSFSRNPIIKNVKYVQDRLFFEKKLICDLILNNNGLIYICGSSGKMPIQLRITILDILTNVGGLTPKQSEDYLVQMENTNRYLQETW